MIYIIHITANIKYYRYYNFYKLPMLYKIHKQVLTNFKIIVLDNTTFFGTKIYLISKLLLNNLVILFLFIYSISKYKLFYQQNLIQKDIVHCTYYNTILTNKVYMFDRIKILKKSK